MVDGKLPALLGKDRSFLPHPSPRAWKMLTVPVHIDPIPVLDAGAGNLMNSIKTRILSGCGVLGFLGGFWCPSHQLLQRLGGTRGCVGALGVNVLSWEKFRRWKWKHWELWASCLIAFLIGTV